MLTAVQLCSQACVLIGAQPIASLADGTTEATVADQLYEAVAQDMLTRHRWRFATRQRALTAVTLTGEAEAPDDRWSAFYGVPSDCLVVHALTVAGTPIEFDRQGGVILCNAAAADEVVLTYGFRASEAQWPPYFDAIVRLQLASVFATAIANREGMADAMEKRALRALASGRQLDSQGRTTSRFDTGGIIRARRATRA